MKAALLGVLLLACASAPAPKVPDESHRVPVNRVVPLEAETDEGTQKKAPTVHREGGGVEWR